MDAKPHEAATQPGSWRVEQFTGGPFPFFAPGLLLGLAAGAADLYRRKCEVGDDEPDRTLSIPVTPLPEAKLPRVPRISPLFCYEDSTITGVTRLFSWGWKETGGRAG